MKYKHSKPGFTLLELLIVVAILGMVMVGVTQMLATTLSGAGKSNALQSAKENGQSIMATMERIVRRAKQVNTCTGGMGNGTLEVVVAEDSGDVTYSFTKPGGQTQFFYYNDGLGGGDINLLSDGTYIQSFSCGRIEYFQAGNPGPGKPVVLTLSLNLYKSAASAEDQVLNQSFYTTVSLRTY